MCKINKKTAAVFITYVQGFNGLSKKLINALKDKNIPEGEINKKVYRPWGFFISLEEHPNWQVKILSIIYAIGITGDFRTKPYKTYVSNSGLISNILEIQGELIKKLLYLSSSRIYINNFSR